MVESLTYLVSYDTVRTYLYCDRSARHCNRRTHCHYPSISTRFPTIAPPRRLVTITPVITREGLDPARSAARIDELLAGLNDDQRVAVSHRGSPLLVVAGPGSGKTRVLTTRIASLIAEGMDPRKILAVTFTNKAAAEMRARVHALVPSDGPMPHVSTFHSLCVRILREYGHLIDIPRGFSIVDTSDAERVMGLAIASLSDANPPAPSRTPGADPAKVDKKEVRSILSAISYAKNTLQSIDTFARSNRPSDAFIARAWSHYQERLREMGAVDFDDLLLATRDVLMSIPPDAEPRTRFEAILVDEWQDTNAPQYDIVALLAGIAPATRDICVVGDPEQAIYAWRGSSSAVIDRFTHDFAPCEVVHLGHNYRSTPEIVAAAAAVAAQGSSGLANHLRTDNPSGEPVAIMNATDPDDEARRVVDQLRRRSGDRAVIVRTNAQTRVFEAALTAAGIAHQLVGMTRFTDRSEVKDAMAYLRLAVNPADVIAFSRAVSSPRRGCGPAAQQVFFDACAAAGISPGEGLFDESVRTSLPKRVATSIDSFASTMRTVQESRAAGPSAMVSAVLDCGLRAAYATDVERLENLNELIGFARSFEEEHTLLSAEDAVLGFVEHAALVSSTDTVENAPVSVITAHASKGREFDHVWVVGVEQGVFPHQMALPDDLDEERRLFFVAVSRARSTLTVSHRTRHFRAGEWSSASPSEFIDCLRPPGSSRPALSTRTVLRTDNSLRRPPAPIGPRLDPASVHVGLVVNHTTFGSGTITAFVGSTAHINFGGKTRILDIEYAPLVAESS